MGEILLVQSGYFARWSDGPIVAGDEQERPVCNDAHFDRRHIQSDRACQRHAEIFVFARSGETRDRRLEDVTGRLTGRGKRDLTVDEQNRQF